jgi:hypothetical protein
MRIYFGFAYNFSKYVQCLTALDSNSEDFEDDLSLVDLDSPHGLVGEEEDEEEELCPALSSSAHGTRAAAAAHTCDECLKSFASPGKLRQHEYSHTGETPFECRIQGEGAYTSQFCTSSLKSS